MRSASAKQMRTNMDEKYVITDGQVSRRSVIMKDALAAVHKRKETTSSDKSGKASSNRRSSSKGHKKLGVDSASIITVKTAKNIDKAPMRKISTVYDVQVSSDKLQKACDTHRKDRVSSATLDYLKPSKYTSKSPEGKLSDQDVGLTSGMVDENGKLHPLLLINKSSHIVAKKGVEVDRHGRVIGFNNKPIFRGVKIGNDGMMVNKNGVIAVVDGVKQDKNGIFRDVEGWIKRKGTLDVQEFPASKAVKASGNYCGSYDENADSAHLSSGESSFKRSGSTASAKLDKARKLQPDSNDKDQDRGKSNLKGIAGTAENTDSSQYSSRTQPSSVSKNSRTKQQDQMKPNMLSPLISETSVSENTTNKRERVKGQLRIVLDEPNKHELSKEGKNGIEKFGSVRKSATSGTDRTDADSASISQDYTSDPTSRQSTQSAQRISKSTTLDRLASTSKIPGMQEKPQPYKIKPKKSAYFKEVSPDNSFNRRYTMLECSLIPQNYRSRTYRPTDDFEFRQNQASNFLVVTELEGTAHLGHKDMGNTGIYDTLGEAAHEWRLRECDRLNNTQKEIGNYDNFGPEDIDSCGLPQGKVFGRRFPTDLMNIDTSAVHQTSRFELPLDMKLLETMTPQEYLEKYCIVSPRRQTLYQKLFLKHKDVKTQGIPSKNLDKIFNEILIGTLTQEQMESVLDLTQINEDSLIKQRFFYGLCALTERLFFMKNMNEDSTTTLNETQREPIEVADFFSLDYKFKGINVNTTMMKLLKAL